VGHWEGVLLHAADVEVPIKEVSHGIGMVVTKLEWLVHYIDGRRDALAGDEAELDHRTGAQSVKNERDEQDREHSHDAGATVGVTLPFFRVSNILELGDVQVSNR